MSLSHTQGTQLRHLASFETNAEGTDTLGSLNV